MPQHIGVSGVWRPIKSQWIGVSGVWRQVIRVWIGVSGTWRLAFSAQPIVTISPSSVSGASSASPVTSGYATASVEGGSGSYTYSWTQISGDSITILTPTDYRTQFRAAMPAGTTRSGTFRCTVTDTVTGMTGFANVNVQLDRF